MIVLGYGLAALTKPLFPLAGNAATVMGARFLDRIAKGIRGAPRDAMVADETPPAIRGRAFGLRQSLDTVGALLAPIAAIALMLALAGDIRLVFWIAVIPAILSAALAWVALSEPARHVDAGKAAPVLAGFRSLEPETRRLLVVGFLFAVARFSEAFLILKGIEIGLSESWSPATLVLFNLAYVLLAFPAGALSDRVAPKALLMAALGVLIAGNLVLARADNLWLLALGTLLWGAHMALSQGIFSRMIADTAPADQRATAFGAFWFVSGIGTLLASLGAGYLWDKDGSAMTFIVSAAIAAVAAAMLSLIEPRRAN